MAIGLKLSPEKMDTITNHGTQTSGNTIFLSLPVGKPAEKPEFITDISVPVSGREVAEKLTEDLREQWRMLWRARMEDKIKAEGIASQDYPKLFAEKGAIITATRDYKPLNFHEILERQLPLIETRILPRPTPVATNIRVLIDQETNKLDVLSDGIGPALLSVLHVYGSMSITQILGSLDITKEDLISHLATLERARLVTLADERYFITDEGIEFLRELGLRE